MIYADSWAAPRRDSALQILQRAGNAPSLAALVRSISEVNPLYAELRDAAWAQMQSNGGTLDPRVLTSLDRARDMPFQSNYIMVDTASARLYMIEDGKIADSMKVASVSRAPRPKPRCSPARSITRPSIPIGTSSRSWSVADRRERPRAGSRLFVAAGISGMPADPTMIGSRPRRRRLACGRGRPFKVRVRELPGPATRWAT